MLLSVGFYCLFSSQNSWLLSISMFMLGLLGTMIATSNIASLLRTVENDEEAKLKVISLELILFNISFSFITYILLDLNPQQILLFVQFVIIILVGIGGWGAIRLLDPIFRAKPTNTKYFDLFMPRANIREFLTLMSMILCFGLIFSMVKVVFTPTLIERFGSNMISVTVASINPWIMFFVQPIMVNRIKSSNSTWFLGIGGLIVGMSYFSFGLVNSFLLTSVILILLTFGEMMFAPLSKHFNVQLYGKGHDGVASGVWRAVFLGSGTIGPEVSGYLAENYGAYAVWDVCALLGLSCFILSLFLRRIKNRDLCNRVVFES
jgi:predicted MFS family arabinose efflux permease